MTELLKRLADLDEYATFWEFGEGVSYDAGMRLIYPDAGYEHSNYLQENGTFQYQREEAKVIGYCVRRLEAMGYRRFVPAMFLDTSLRHVSLRLNDGVQTFWGGTELEATLKALLFVLDPAREH